MTRAEAKALGAKTYEGVKRCKKCGGTERLVRTYLCTACSHDILTRRARDAYRKRRKVLDGREFVYECYSATDELIYVGRTNHPYNRINTHRNETPWWHEVERMRWVQVHDLERERIVALRPKYNKHGSK